VNNSRGDRAEKTKKKNNATFLVARVAVTRTTQAVGGAQIQRLWSVPARAAVPDLLELARAADPDMGRAEHPDHRGAAGQRPLHGGAHVLLSHGDRGGE